MTKWGQRRGSALHESAGGADEECQIIKLTTGGSIAARGTRNESLWYRADVSHTSLLGQSKTRIKRVFFVPKRGLEHYMFSRPFGYILPLVESISKAFQVL